MKLGFSTAACPAWDLDTIVTRAAETGYDTVELCSLQGETHLPASMLLAHNGEAVARKFRDAGVELACLATRNTFDSKDRHRIEVEQIEVRQVLELAGELGCPFVRVRVGDLERGRKKDAVLAQAVRALRQLAPVATACHAMIVVENAGGFGGSRDLWHVLDAVDHPAVRGCWNPLEARLAGDVASLAVPRLGRRIAMMRVNDATFDAAGRIVSREVPGQGQLEVERCLMLLRGVGFDGQLIVDWPPDASGEPADPSSQLAAAPRVEIQAILERLGATPELSAYKGDKNPPKFTARGQDAAVAG